MCTTRFHRYKDLFLWQRLNSFGIFFWKFGTFSWNLGHFHEIWDIFIKFGTFSWSLDIFMEFGSFVYFGLT